MTKKHKNIPIFIPHEGCPNCCVFCSQRKITGVKDTELSLLTELGRCRALIEESLKTIDGTSETEIAFFGGSFTAIDEERMIALLELGYEYVKNGRVSGIRLSTRPDFIDEHKLNILKQYGVKAVELGVQSMSDEVLMACKRGHKADDSRRSGRMIAEYGFEYVGQMMIGLPESTLETELMTAREIIESGAKCSRIYPTITIEGTELYQMYLDGRYRPLELDEAVERSSRVLELFLENGVKVLRIGLQSSEEMEKNPFYHSAFGELTWNALYYRKMKELLKGIEEKSVVFTVEKTHVSKAVGQKRSNVVRLAQESGKNIKIKGSPFHAAGEVTAEII
ncbi:MAG: radical SAM protein [Clostridia bacterium]|nr:radical SAM protein [Clostridia bacterium]